MKRAIGLTAGGAPFFWFSNEIHASEKKEKNGVDCKDPVCDDAKSNFFKAMGGKQKKSNVECPLNRAEYGRATWQFLHTTAAYYPQNPTDDQKQAAKGLMDGVAGLYACPSCREHLQSDLEKHPIDFTSRDTFSRDLCTLHNKVNKFLGKEIFSCSSENLQQRYRTGYTGCFQSENPISYE